MARWRLDELAALHWRHWGEEWVSFDEGSGQTFVTDAVVAAALMVLESGPQTLVELERQVREDLHWPEADPLAERIAEGLQFMTGLGLVRLEAL